MFSPIFHWLIVIILVILTQQPILIHSRLTDLTILKSVQLLLRHGDRTPIKVTPPEPYYNKWPEGFGQLTRKGRAKSYRLGQLLREHYKDYLGSRFSVREAYVRSSALDRCVETAQLVMAGLYPPNSTLSQWHFNSYSLPLASLWQPTPIQTFIPASEDSLLRMDKPCPVADQIKQSLLGSKRNRRLLQRHRQLLDQIEQIIGKPLDSIEVVSDVHENLKIMHENNYFWYKWNESNINPLNWTEQIEEDAIKQLRLFEIAKYRSMFDDKFIKQIRTGELLSVIGETFQSKRSVQQPGIDERDTRIVVYSTHDLKIAALLQTLNVWNEQLVPYLATLMFELHQSIENSSQYYVQVWYLNETTTLFDQQQLQLYRLDIPGCDHDELDEHVLMCPLDDFLSIIQNYSPPKDWQHDCGIHSDLTAMISVNIFLLIVNLTMMFLLLMSIMYVCSCINHRSGYESLS